MQQLPTRLREERGSISIMAAVLMAAMVMAAALAVDVGRVAFTSRDQQGVTDRLTLDAVREIGNGYSSVEELYDRAVAAAADTMGVNVEGSAVGTSRDRQLTNLEVGWVDPQTGTFYVYWDKDGAGPAIGMAATQEPTVFKTYTESYVDFVFGFLDAEGGRTVTKESLGTIMPQTCATPPCFPTKRSCADYPLGYCVRYYPATAGVAVSSRLVEFDTSQSLLAPLMTNLLRSSASLSLAGWDGLATSTINVRRLSTALGFASPNEMLTSQASFRNLMTASASALTSPDANTQADATTAFSELSAQSDSDLVVDFADIVSLDTTGDSSLAEFEIPALDLVMTSAIAAAIADGNNLITASVAGTDLLGYTGLGAIDVQLDLIEAPQWSIGPAEWIPDTDTNGDGVISDTEKAHWKTQARTAQIDVTISLTANAFYLLDIFNGSQSLIDVSLTCALGPLVCGDVTVDTTIAAAQAVGSLINVGCVFDDPSLTTIDTVLEQDAVVAVVDSTAGTLADSRDLGYPQAGVNGELVVDIAVPGAKASANTSLSASPAIDSIVNGALAAFGLSVGTAEVSGFGADCTAPTLLTIADLDL